MPSKLPALLASCVLLSSAVPALAASSPDAQFARVAAQGGMAEVQSAQLALQKSKNATVRAFAQHMIADHTPNNAKLAAIMKAEGIPKPASLDPNSRAMMLKLQGLNGAAFNSAYMSGQVKAHEQMQTLMQSETNGGTNARLKAYAKMTLSAVNEHLNMAKTDVASLRGGGSMGGAMSSGAMGGSSGSMGSSMGSMGGSRMPMSHASNSPMSGGSSPGPNAQSGTTGAASGMPSGPMASPRPMSSSMPMPRPT